MNPAAQLIFHLPKGVREETLRYRSQVERFLRGDLSPAAFQACRVPMGVYEQRNPRTYMVRVRIGAGFVSSGQLRCIAELSRKHGNGVVHVTTRQDSQIHDVKIEQTPDVLEGLLHAGLTSCRDGANAMCDVSACPRAGTCPLEQFDASPHAIALAQYLRQFDGSHNLPHECRIAFAGCGEDCTRASAADLGFFAHHRNGMKGFALYADGGIETGPAVGVRIDNFVEQREIFEAAEAVKRLLDRYGDRSNKHQARLRYVLARFGPEEFTRLYRKERQTIRRQGREGELPAIAESPDRTGVRIRSAAKAKTTEPTDHDLLPEKDKHFHALKLTPPLGGVLADDLIRIAQIAETYGAGVVQITRQRNLLVPSIPKTRIKALHRELRTLRVEVSADGQPKVVACAGSSTRRLGLRLSRGLARAIASIAVCMTFVPIFSRPASAEPSEFAPVPPERIADVLKTISDTSRANYERLRTWEGEVQVVRNTVYGGDQVKRVLDDAGIAVTAVPPEMLESMEVRIEFGIDLANDSLYSINRAPQPVAYKHAGTGATIATKESPGYKQAVVTRESYLYTDSAVSGGRPGTKAAIKNKRPSGCLPCELPFVFDPRSLFGTPDPAWQTFPKIVEDIKSRSTYTVDGQPLKIEEKRNGDMIDYRVRLPGKGDHRETVLITTTFTSKAAYNPILVEFNAMKGKLLRKGTLDYETLDGVFLPVKTTFQRYGEEDGQLVYMSDIKN